MNIDLGKMDYGQGMLGFLVYSMTGQGSLKFTPEDEGTTPVTTCVSPKARKMLQQLSAAGGVSMTVITRTCIETGLEHLSQLLGEVKAAQEAARETEAAMYEAHVAYDEEAELSGILENLTELQKLNAARKAAMK